VYLKDIELNKVSPVSESEKTTFDFVRLWLKGQSTFDIKTSGSTGIPKVISIRREQMQASARLTQEALQLKDHYNALICLDVNYIAGQMMIVRCFETGMRMFIVDACANPLIKVPIHYTLHFTALVPYQVKAIIESNHPHLLDTLQTIIIGGASLDASSFQSLQQYSSRIYATYGMTETISHVALQPLNGINKSDCYQTLPGISIHKDERGCLIIDALHLDERIITNDVVDIVDEKSFRWIGRWDTVINSGGIKVSPEILEEQIGQIFTRLDVKNNFFIHSVPDSRLGEKIILIMEEPLPEAQVLNESFQALLHSISPYKLPRELYLSSRFIRTPTTKINRKESFKNASFQKHLKI
jgi:O-succinylbenzoic acid--CoA ligase